MKKIRLLLLSMMSAALSAGAVAPIGVDSLTYTRSGDFMVVDMSLDLRPTDVKSSRAQLITPLIASAQGDTVALPAIAIYGRQRYINYLRNDRAALAEIGQSSFKASERPEDYSYEATVPYREWMGEGSTLLLRRQLFGCANCLIEETDTPMAEYVELKPGIPQIQYIDVPETDPIIESLEGASFIDFVVNKTDINPEYRRNPQELLKIKSTIDTVLNDKDVTITGVWLKGFASPESPYSHNRDLAIGRTEALKRYIGSLYSFGPDIISTDYEPEDWNGLRNFVEKSNIAHREEILSLIDADMDPDKKEALIKKSFPKEYKYMLDNFYPALRHTEYKITYKVKRFDDINKIREVMRTRPNRLTLREFYLLGNECEPGSDEFNEVFETAVRMYPDNPVANINAANAALQRKDYVMAERYLSKAGDSPEAVYGRGSLAFIQGDYERAEQLMSRLPQMEAAREVIAEIKRLRDSKTSVTVPMMIE